MNFAELITAARAYLPSFDYDRYPACFQAFERDAAPLFAELDDTDASKAAISLVDALETGREALRPRMRKIAADEEKRVLALFLSPAASRYGGKADLFAQVLMNEWNSRYPRNTFLLGNYDTLMRGFDANLLGLPLRKSKVRH